MPAYQSWTMAGTLARQASITTALPAMSATTVRGLSAATAAIRASSSGWRRSDDRSPPTENPPASVAGTDPGAKAIVPSASTSAAKAAASSGSSGPGNSAVSSGVPVSPMNSPSSARV